MPQYHPSPRTLRGMRDGSITSIISVSTDTALKKGALVAIREETSVVGGKIVYKIDEPADNTSGVSWISSIFMPKEAQRYTLVVTEGRTIPIQDLTEEQIRKSGVEDVSTFPRYWNVNLKKEQRKEFAYKNNPTVLYLEFDFENSEQK